MIEHVNTFYTERAFLVQYRPISRVVIGREVDYRS